MLELTTTTQFRRDYKLAKKRGLDMDGLGDVIGMLLRQEELPPRMQDHALSGRYTGKRECHITPDWLLVYRVSEGKLIADRTGSHADLFD